MFKNKLVRYLILILIIFFMTITLFWREILDSAAGSVTAILSDDIKQEPMMDKDFKQLKEVRFENIHNNLAQVKVDNLKVVNQSDHTVTLSVKIMSQTGDNDFPNLRVAILSRSGSTLRTINFLPTEYTHGDTFGSNTIELPIQVKAGDASFAVSAYYKDEVVK